MIWFVRLIGLAVVVLGLVYAYNLEVMKKVMRYWIRKKRRYSAGILNIVFSVVFLLAARECRFSLFVFAVGILSLVKGIVLITMKDEAFARRINQLLDRPAAFLRTWAIAAIIFGLILISAA